MRVIVFIEDEDVIKKILKHLDLDLLEVKRKPLPRAKGPPLIPDSYSAPGCRNEALAEGRSVDDYVIDADFTIVAYGYDG